MCCLDNTPIGIFGGTFNPIHIGHIKLALKAYEELKLNKIYVMPSGNPPHKKNQNNLDAFHRCEMVKLAIKDFPQLEFSDYEVKKEGYSYSALTLTEWSNRFSDIYFIIGADSFFQIETWYHPEIVMKLSTLVVANRDRHMESELKETACHLKEKYGARIVFLNMEDVPVSSSKIRENVMANVPVDGMVCNDVLRYIHEHNLYESERSNDK